MLKEVKSLDYPTIDCSSLMANEIRWCDFKIIYTTAEEVKRPSYNCWSTPGQICMNHIQLRHDLAKAKSPVLPYPIPGKCFRYLCTHCLPWWASGFEYIRYIVITIYEVPTDVVNQSDRSTTTRHQDGACFRCKAQILQWDDSSRCPQRFIL